MSVYQRIKNRRIALNLSQEDLAKKLGYKSRSSVNKIELGKTDISTVLLEKFAKALQCSPAYLMGWEDSPDRGEAAHRSDADLADLPKDEKDLVSDYRKLNTTGKDKAREYVNDLTDNEKYTEDLLDKLNGKEIG